MVASSTLLATEYSKACNRLPPNYDTLNLWSILVVVAVPDRGFLLRETVSAYGTTRTPPWSSTEHVLRTTLTHITPSHSCRQAGLGIFWNNCLSNSAVTIIEGLEHFRQVRLYLIRLLRMCRVRTPERREPPGKVIGIRFSEGERLS
jgi:hypothetical protein